jgi:hypothetical protein
MHVDLNDYYASLRRWAGDYEETLRKWAVARNLAVHYPDRLSDAEIRDTIALCDGLLIALERYLPPGARRYGEQLLLEPSADESP